MSGEDPGPGEGFGPGFSHQTHVHLLSQLSCIDHESTDVQHVDSCGLLVVDVFGSKLREKKKRNVGEGQNCLQNERDTVASTKHNDILNSFIRPLVVECGICTN